VTRCRFCGSAIPTGLEGCPACDDAGESLPALELDDGELGVRVEDRFVHLPGTGEGIRRRVHDDSYFGSVTLLIGLVLFFALATWLS
jgi:hypothetical protein